MNDFKLLRSDRADIRYPALRWRESYSSALTAVLDHHGPPPAFPKMLEALKVCADDAWVLPCPRLAWNSAASTRTCAAMRRIGVLHAGDP